MLTQIEQAARNNALWCDTVCRAHGIPGEFRDLDFRLLFEATWLWRAPGVPKPDGAVAGIRWVTVQESPELARWETAWNGLLAGEQSTLLARVFLPALLTGKDIVFIAAYRDEQIVAGDATW